MTDGNDLPVQTILSSIQSLETRLKQGLDDVNQKVEEMARTQGRSQTRSPSPRRKDTGHPSRFTIPWADRTDTIRDRSPLREGEWDDHTMEHGGDQYEVSEETLGLLKNSLHKPLDNSQKRVPGTISHPI